MRELTHTVLSDISAFVFLYDVRVREDKIVVCGDRRAAIFKLIYCYTRV